MNQEHGQTEKISGGCNLSGTETESQSVGTARHQSQDVGADTFFSSGENRDGRDNDWKLTPVRDTTAGKILERLENLEAKYLDYVHSHQARLEARLGESKKDEEKFINEASQIKSDIYHLAIAQQQTNGNGHIN